MTRYYFTQTALPALKLGEVPEISFHDLMNLLYDNLTKEDWDQVQVICRWIDVQNIASLCLGRPLDIRGNLTAVTLPEAIAEQAGLPDYVLEVTGRYEGEELLHHHGEIVAHFFQAEIEKARGFLRQYLQFEREWRLVLLAFRARLEGRDLALELQYEDPGDELVHHIVAGRDMKTFEPPDEYLELVPLFKKWAEDPMALYQALAEYRWRQVDGMLEGDVFLLRNLLGYVVKHMIAQDWIRGVS